MCVADDTSLKHDIIIESYRRDTQTSDSHCRQRGCQGRRHYNNLRCGNGWSRIHVQEGAFQSSRAPKAGCDSFLVTFPHAPALRLLHSAELSVASLLLLLRERQ